jgi:hypothetical protein
MKQFSAFENYTHQACCRKQTHHSANNTADTDKLTAQIVPIAAVYIMKPKKFDYSSFSVDKNLHNINLENNSNNGKN